jgi:ElaB/YqjD/DUF883 family membrane-anchored ribosome-binding protein
MRAAKKTQRSKRPKKNRQENIMAEENQTTTPDGGTIPAAAQNKFESSKTHVRKAAEDLRSAAGVMAGDLKSAAGDLRSAAGVMAEEYKGKAEQAWEDARERVRTLQDDGEQYVRENPTKAVFTALGIGFVLGLIFRR